MNTKQETVKLLKELKNLKISRRMIEKDLDYAEKSIDQILSRGSNPGFLSVLKRYHKQKLADIENSNIMFHVESGNIIEEIAALKAAVTVITEEIVELKANPPKEKSSSTSVSLELGKRMQQQLQLILDELRKKAAEQDRD